MPRLGSRHRVAFVPFPAGPMFVIGAVHLVSFTCPSTSTRSRARPPARGRVGVLVAVERRYRLPPLPDMPVPYTLTAEAETLLAAEPERADLVPLPGGREVTA